MRFIPLIALLPALAVAEEQVPLADRVQGWFNKAKSYLPTATPVIPIAEKVAEVPEKVIQEKTVTPFNTSNWQALLEPATDAQDWLVFVTGGNKTCFGRCGKAEEAFNQSVLLFAADPTSPNLGYLDCESNQLLCSAWSAGAPSVWYFNVPQAQATEGRPSTPLHVVYVNSTTVTPDTIYKIHSEKTYENKPAYEGAFHPTDGWLAQYGLLMPLGYVIYGFGVVPSWLFMIVISMASRTMIKLFFPLNIHSHNTHHLMAELDRVPPSTTTYVVATAIIAGITGYFIGQGASLGLFSTREKEGWPNSYNVKLHQNSSDEDDNSEKEEESDEEEGDGTELASFEENTDEVKLVLVVRTDLGMTKGKIAAQCSHATLACYKYLAANPSSSTILRRWEGQGQAKIALQIKSEEEMQELQAQAISLGLCARIIQDAGRTQIASGSRTVLGILGPKSVVDAVTGHLKLL
ncbi:PTH2-domain-containing protein [Aspergillus desertorum]